MKNFNKNWQKLKIRLEKLKQLYEKLKKSWKYSIFGKFIYSICLNCGEKKACIKHSEFQIRTKLEPENWFSRWYLYYIVQRGAGASQKAAKGRILASCLNISLPFDHHYF